MKKTLYITDLDGTLLGNEAALTDFAIGEINRFLDGGGLFTVATARSQQATIQLLEPLRMRLPMVLSNGATIYDPVKKQYIQVNALTETQIRGLVDIFDKRDLCGFLYTLKDNLLSIFYVSLRHPVEQWYRDFRMDKYDRRVYACRDYLDLPPGYQPVYFVIYGPESRLKDAADEVLRLPGVTGSFYNNVYDDNFFMDIYSDAASKKNGMLAVAQIVGADELVAFGDNSNDLEMLRRADRAYVPVNGIPEAKELATGILPHCKEDGVAKFLAEEWRSTGAQ